MAIDWEVAARIEELKRNPPTVWRGGPGRTRRRTSRQITPPASICLRRNGPIRRQHEEGWAPSSALRTGSA